MPGSRVLRLPGFLLHPFVPGPSPPRFKPAVRSLPGPSGDVGEPEPSGFGIRPSFGIRLPAPCSPLCQITSNLFSKIFRVAGGCSLRLLALPFVSLRSPGCTRPSCFPLARNLLLDCASRKKWIFRNRKDMTSRAPTGRHEVAPDHISLRWGAQSSARRPFVSICVIRVSKMPGKMR